jgi:NAD(P)-dependent dehydrogenase (short-subunit alcohol dehydrogenase family)
MRLAGKVRWSRASRGIGRAIAERFAAEGAAVASRNLERAETVATGWSAW